MKSRGRAWKQKSSSFSFILNIQRSLTSSMTADKDAVTDILRFCVDIFASFSLVSHLSCDSELLYNQQS